MCIRKCTYFPALCSHAMLSSFYNHWNIFSSTTTFAATKYKCIYMHLFNKAIIKDMHKWGGKCEFCAKREWESEKKKKTNTHNHRVLLVNLKGSSYPIRFVQPFFALFRFVCLEYPMYFHLSTSLRLSFFSTCSVYLVYCLSYFICRESRIYRAEHLRFISFGSYKNETKLKIDSFYFCSVWK